MTRVTAFSAIRLISGSWDLLGFISCVHVSRQATYNLT